MTATRAPRVGGLETGSSALRATTTPRSRAARSRPVPTTSPSAACSRRPPSPPPCAPPSPFSRRGVPLCAIGGITLENAPLVLGAGADLLAVVTDLFDAPDIRARAAQYQRLFA